MSKIRIVVTGCAIVVPVFFLYQSCGITKPRYIEYAGDSPPSSIDGSTNGTYGTTGSALTVFTEKVQPSITSTCGTSSCHGSGAGGLTLTTSDVDGNRTALKSYAEDSAQKVFDKISSSSHGGGDQSAKLSLAALETWITAESSGGSEGTEAPGGTEAAEPECPPEGIFLAKIKSETLFVL